MEGGHLITSGEQVLVFFFFGFVFVLVVVSVSVFVFVFVVALVLFRVLFGCVLNEATNALFYDLFVLKQ